MSTGERAIFDSYESKVIGKWRGCFLVNGEGKVQ